MPVEQAVLDFHPLEELTGDSGSPRAARPARRRLARHGQRQPRGRPEGRPLADHGRPHLVRRPPLARRRRPPRHGRRGRGARRRRRPGHQHRRPPGRRAALRAHPADGRPGRHRRRRRAAWASRRSRPRPSSSRSAPAPHPRARTPRQPPASSRPSARTFVDEVRGSLDYYLASSGSTPISRLVLTGGGARLAGLAERLQADDPRRRSRSARRCTACRSVAPGSPRSRSHSSSRWPQCRSDWPSESHHEHPDHQPAWQRCLGSTCCHRRSSRQRRFRHVQAGLGGGGRRLAGRRGCALRRRERPGRQGAGRPRRQQGASHRSCRRRSPSTRRSRWSTAQVEAAQAQLGAGDGPGGPLVLLPQRPEPEDPAPRLARHR